MPPCHSAARAFSFTSFTSFASLTSSKSFTILTSKTPLPQVLYNPHLRAPLGSAGNKGLITTLESALTENSPATPLESALTKTGGWGHSGSSFWIILLSCAGDSTWPLQRLSLRGLGGSSELPRLWGAGASDHLCEFARRGRPARVWRTARCRVRASPAQWSILCRVVRTGKVRKLVTNRDSPACPDPVGVTSHAFWYDLIWDPCGLNAFRCFR